MSGEGCPDLCSEQAPLPFVLLLLVAVATIGQQFLGSLEGERFLFQGLQLLDTCTEILARGFESRMSVTDENGAPFRYSVRPRPSLGAHQ